MGKMIRKKPAKMFMVVMEWPGQYKYFVFFFLSVFGCIFKGFFFFFFFLNYKKFFLKNGKNCVAQWKNETHRKT